MFDIGWPEMAVIMLVAIIVIGPKDLPRLARQIGQWTGKARAMAREFQRSLDDMAREAELEDIKKSLDTARSPAKLRNTLTKSVKDAIDPDDELDEAMRVEESRSIKSASPSPAVAKPALPEPPSTNATPAPVTPNSGEPKGTA